MEKRYELAVEPQGGDSSVCRHGLYYKTLSSVVFDVKTKTTYFCDGNPCKAARLDAYPFEFNYSLPAMRFYEHYPNSTTTPICDEPSEMIAKNREKNT